MKARENGDLGWREFSQFITMLAGTPQWKVERGCQHFMTRRVTPGLEGFPSGARRNKNISALGKKRISQASPHKCIKVQI